LKPRSMRGFLFESSIHSEIDLMITGLRVAIARALEEAY
jgi:hypothetical protein